ncbi:MAG: hypothetical protein HZA92_06225 [Verrucomicrobia bacterium]|nr:hypothetical protein [Verrucomicrobiota bacterium]
MTLLCLAAAPLFATNLPPATVSFLDGSFLRGEIQSLNSETLNWRHPNARQPIEFTTTNLNSIRLPARSLALPTNSAPVCRVQLASGDEFEGQLLSLDSESFEIETWFAGRLRGRRSGLASLAFYGSSQSALYDGPRAAGEWRSSVVGSSVINRVGIDVFGGGNVFIRPAIPAPPQPIPAPANPIDPVLLLKAELARLGERGAPALKEALEKRIKELEAASNAKELVAKRKDQLEKLGDRAVPAVKEALEKALKAAEATAGKEDVKVGVAPLPLPGRAPRPAAPAVERRARDLVNALLAELTRQQQTVIVNYLVGWELALLDGQRLAVRVIPPVPLNATAPPLAPQIDPVAQKLRIEIEKIADGAGAARPLLPPLPPVEMSAPAAKPIARKTFAEDEVTKLTDAAGKAASVAEFLKSDLVTTALAEKQTSRVTLDRWFAEFEQPVDWQGDAVKTARFKAMVRAEADLIGRRLLGRAAVFAEMPAQQAEAQARGNLAANALADARVRALDALRLNMANPNLVLRAEGALAGRAAAGASTNAAWTFRDDAYYTAGVGTLGRECNLPEKARVEFDMAWKGQPYFRFQFFARNTDQFDMGDGWQFYTSSSGYIYPMRRSGFGAGGVSNARVPQMLSKSTVRLTFLLDREKETALLLADGEKIHEWKSLGRPGEGTGIVFYNYNTSSRIRISDIRISPWDGRDRTADPLGAGPEKLAEAPPADSAVVEFVNNDRSSGTLHGIRDGRLSFNPAGTRLEIPLARASQIFFPANAAPALPRVEGVQVTLHRNERLTLALEKWDAEEITAVSPVFGRLKLKPESVRALRFNPSAPRGPVDEWSGP